MILKRPVGEIKVSHRRNKACDCGSGKKYKNCCLNKNIIMPKIDGPNDLGNYIPKNKRQKSTRYMIRHEDGSYLDYGISNLSWTNNIEFARRFKNIELAGEIIVFLSKMNHNVELVGE